MKKLFCQTLILSLILPLMAYEDPKGEIYPKVIVHKNQYHLIYTDNIKDENIENKRILKIYDNNSKLIKVKQFNEYPHLSYTHIGSNKNVFDKLDGFLFTKDKSQYFIPEYFEFKDKAYFISNKNKIFFSDAISNIGKIYEAVFKNNSFTLLFSEKTKPPMEENWTTKIDDSVKPEEPEPDPILFLCNYNLDSRGAVKIKLGKPDISVYPICSELISYKNKYLIVWYEGKYLKQSDDCKPVYAYTRLLLSLWNISDNKLDTYILSNKVIAGHISAGLIGDRLFIAYQNEEKYYFKSKISTIFIDLKDLSKKYKLLKSHGAKTATELKAESTPTKGD